MKRDSKEIADVLAGCPLMAGLVLTSDEDKTDIYTEGAWYYNLHLKEEGSGRYKEEPPILRVLHDDEMLFGPVWENRLAAALREAVEVRALDEFDTIHGGTGRLSSEEWDAHEAINERILAAMQEQCGEPLISVSLFDTPHIMPYEKGMKPMLILRSMSDTVGKLLSGLDGSGDEDICKDILRYVKEHGRMFQWRSLVRV